MMATCWTLLIHGGAGRIERARTSAQAAARAGLNAGLDAGAAVLMGDGGAFDAVEAAVRVLEDDPAFNAGRGAALSGEGTAELDAAIMDGTTRRAGAVAGVSRTRHPVSLARAVMERSPHVLLAGPGADAFSLEQRLEQAEPDWFVTTERLRHWRALAASGRFDTAMEHGTVGAVALDQAGGIAAATSTGGIAGQRAGRVGDSPLIGAGTYADARGAAVSCTGAGEAFIRAAVAAEVSTRVRLLGQAPGEALAAALDEVRALGGTGGAIAIAANGAAAWRFTTPGMNRARCSSEGECVVALFGDEAGGHAWEEG